MTESLSSLNIKTLVYVSYRGDVVGGRPTHKLLMMLLRIHAQQTAFYQLPNKLQ